MNTTVYIDGFNSYYRLLKSRPRDQMGQPRGARSPCASKEPNYKGSIFYGRVSGRLDPDAPHRQQLYLDALSAVPEVEIHYGSFWKLRNMPVS